MLDEFLDLASGVVLLGIFHVFFLLYQFSYGSQSVHSCAAGLAAGPRIISTICCAESPIKYGMRGLTFRSLLIWCSITTSGARPFVIRKEEHDGARWQSWAQSRGRSEQNADIIQKHTLG